MRHPVQVFRSPPSRAQKSHRLLHVGIGTGPFHLTPDRQHRRSIQKNALKTLEASPKPCRVLDQAELDGWDVDWLQYVDDPEGLQFQARGTLYTPSLPEKAIEQVLAGFQKHARGQLILPCGTGKTAVTLWIAEQQVGLGGRVLYLVPSIALMAQTMREWSGTEEPALALCGHLLGYARRPQ